MTDPAQLSALGAEDSARSRPPYMLVHGGRLMAISDTLESLLRQLSELLEAEHPGEERRLGIERARTQLRAAQTAVQRASVPYLEDR